MGGFYKSGQYQTNQGNQTGTSSSNSTTTPLESDGFGAFRQALTQGFGNALATASAPTYGKAEEAQFLNKNNANTNSSIDKLQSTLASRGIVNSGANAAGVSGILQNSNSNVANYEASVPGFNKASFMNNVGGLLGSGASFAGKAPVGSSTTNTASTAGGQSSVTEGTNNPSPFSDVLGSIGGAAGIAGLGMPGGGFK